MIPDDGHDGYVDVCKSHAARLLLGPLRPNVVVCLHKYRFTLDELFAAKRRKDTT